VIAQPGPGLLDGLLLFGQAWDDLWVTRGEVSSEFRAGQDKAIAEHRAIQEARSAGLK
jgi:hypothetical protein